MAIPNFLKYSITLICLLLLICFANAQGNVDYSDPGSWGGNCQTGQKQSPININTKKLSFCPSINNDFKYLCIANSFEAEDIAFTVQSSNSGYVGINDGTGNGPSIRLYSSLQYHFHAPSQHTVNGEFFPLEMHNFFVAMSNADGTNITLTQTFATFNTSAYTNTNVFAAVLGYFFYPSDSPNAIDLNIHTDENGVAQVNRLELFGCTTSRFWYHYRGSTTTPPCTQTVDWFIYREPLPLKSSNYNALKELINHGNPNNRPVQNLNGRTIYIVGDACPQP